MSDHNILYWLPCLIPVLLLVHFGQNYWRLRHIPGPPLAAFTDLWRLFAVWRGRAETTYLELHKIYGDLVRVGPNCVSISKPDIVQSIYGIGKGFSDFYVVWQNIVNGRRVASMVFTVDESQHAAMKRPIAQAYSLSTLVEFEPFIDSTTAVLFSRLDELFSGSRKICDLGEWLQFYAFDVIGELTFSKRLGFLEEAKDVEGIMSSIAANFDWCSVIGQYPILDLFLTKNPVYLKFFAKPIASPIINFGQRRMMERLNGEGEPEQPSIEIKDPDLKSKELKRQGPSKPDFLSRFLTLRETNPDVVTDKQLLAYLFMNINAGSDTVASTLRAIFYYLFKHPFTLSKLQHESSSARSSNRLSLPLPTWSETQHLPYLSAVIKEGLRLHPALGLVLERVVPASGLQLENKNNNDHTFLPPGTIVGINPWILHRDTRIFGPDAEEWNPDRWLPPGSQEQEDHEHTEQVKRMDAHILTFGAGKRTCLGKNIAMLEIHKLVPAMLMRYEMRLADPEKEWTIRNSWIVRQEGVDVVLSRRNSEE